MVYPRMRVAHGKSTQTGPPYKIYAKSQGKEFDLATILKDQVKLETNFSVEICAVYGPHGQNLTQWTPRCGKKRILKT